MPEDPTPRSEVTPRFPVRVKHEWLPYIVFIGLFAGLVLLIKPLKPIDDLLLTTALRLPRSWSHFFSFISDLGTSRPLTEVIVIWTVLELLFRRWDRALVMAGSALVFPLYELVKFAVHRARPVTDFVALAGLHGDSFPSGHTAGSFAVYVTLAYLINRTLPKPWGAVAGVPFVVLALLIAFSRVYLGAHFPTDVLGGLLVGGFVLFGLREAISKYERAKPEVPRP